nr:MAG TPA: hypothetical protein [Bacteriophage sp.]
MFLFYSFCTLRIVNFLTFNLKNEKIFILVLLNIRIIIKIIFCI